MSMFDKIKSAVEDHEDIAEKVVDKAGDLFDQKTGDKYHAQVDQIQDKIKEQLHPGTDRPEPGKS
ncbi:MAG TPA: antitoxin [Pseudonocardiaceae bacterium]|nr:antitoxin [Pseudonocardiaceae bacterium]